MLRIFRMPGILKRSADAGYAKLIRAVVCKSPRPFHFRVKGFIRTSI